MLYDIVETRDEALTQDEQDKCSNQSEPPQSSGEESDEGEENLPEYQKSPLSTNNRVTKWLQGIHAPGNDTDSSQSTEALLPNIHS